MGRMLSSKPALILGLFLFGRAVAEKSIEIRKSQRKLILLEDGVAVSEYRCALGKGGPGAKSVRGDDKTPEGEYRILAINRRSGYHIFLHLSYPNLEDVEKARKDGRLTDSAYADLVQGIGSGKPPQNSALGGQVGIHGLKNGMGWIGRLHRVRDWTQGCIALTNPEIEELAGQVQAGTRVVIRQ